MKLVINTNVVVSGLLWLGTPGRVLVAASGDRKRLLPLGSYQGIDIVTPTDALARIAAA